MLKRDDSLINLAMLPDASSVPGGNDYMNTSMFSRDNSMINFLTAGGGGYATAFKIMTSGDVSGGGGWDFLDFSS